ncbi:MAG: hybrid sensor histidine kinase/response regulator [Pseudomonadales bacterium]|nr:hybrid sensor histidine kinase/response regulator [Pseudomonadales bacterium]
MAKKVLILEDSKSFAALLATTLKQRQGYESEIAASLQAGEAILKERSASFFAVIVDLNLPDAPHGEAVDMVNEYHLPNIVFTGQLSEGLREDILAKGVSDYVLKSGQYNIDYVVDTIRRFELNKEVKVLVVDDSRIARKQMTRLLESQCYQVLDAESGLVALNMLEENPGISLVITDCHMEGMDGFELTQKLRETYPKEEMSIIGVSSQSGSSISAQFIKSGANDFIVKPFIQEEFNCRVNQNAETLANFAHLKALNAQKNFLMGMAAHDIRNPLGIISKVVKRIVTTQPEREKLNEYMDMVDRSCDGLLNLLGEILDLSRLESKDVILDKGDFHLADILKERVELAATHANEKKITLDVALAANPVVSCDGKRIAQVIDNLLSNALKFSPNGSAVNVQLVAAENEVRLNIIDQGPGVKTDEEGMLFGAFAQLSAKPTGGESSSGLGLAICKSIVAAHGGEVGYERLEAGSCFYFQLPL